MRHFASSDARKKCFRLVHYSDFRARQMLNSPARYFAVFLVQHSLNTMRTLLLLSLSFLLPESECDLLRDSVHVTSAAARPNNELWCYKCLAEYPEDDCANLRQNSSALIHKCNNDRRMCMVKRFSYTTSTENSTTALKMWALERNCTKHCEPGCIIIGERTKLYACTSCCTASLCNYGSGGVRVAGNIIALIGTVLALL